MEIYQFGTAPKATAAGYHLVSTIHSTAQDLMSKHTGEDVIFVRGAAVHGQPGVYEFARFERQAKRGRSAGRCRVSTRNGEKQLAVALQDLQQRISEGQEYPDAEWAVARKHAVDSSALRAAYDAAHAT